MAAIMSIPRKRGLVPEDEEQAPKKVKPLCGPETILQLQWWLMSYINAAPHTNKLTEKEDTLPHGPLPVLPRGEVAATASPSATWPKASTVIVPYDTCFGLLCLPTTSSDEANVPVECTPVTVNFKGKVMGIYLEDETKPLAVIVSDALLRLVNEFAVTLTATICGKKRKSISVKQEGMPKKTVGAQFCSLRIVIYGFIQQKAAVADVLATEELFLQHPGETEFDREVKYVNPQYLLPPGQEMPPIEKLSISTCCGGSGSRSALSRNLLGEDEMNQVHQIFNSAYAPDGVVAVEPSPRLITTMKKHQIEALTMMVEKEAGIYDRPQFPTMWRAFTSPSGQVRYQNIITEMFELSHPPPMGGGILADEMGLGKTLSALSLVCHSLDSIESNPQLSQRPRATLIVTPKSTIYGWEKQIKTHIHPNKVRWITYHGSKRQEAVGDMGNHDIVLTTYDTLRSDEVRKGPIFEHNWRRVILDEAHKIRNRSSKISKAVCGLQATYRWCLTGTPIQNCLNDFGGLLAFIKVPPFQSKDSFDKLITRPIKERRKNAIQTLRKVVTATCLRRTKADYASVLNLTKKAEHIEQVQMSRNDRELYEFFKRFSYLIAGKDKALERRAATNILVLISMLRLICDHGEALLPESALKAWRDRDENSLTWEMLDSGMRHCIACRCKIEELVTAQLAIEPLECGHYFCDSCVTKSDGSASQLSCPRCRIIGSRSPSFGNELTPTPSQTELSNPLKPRYPPSAKVEAILRNIVERKNRPGGDKQPHKAVIFSQWTKMLDLIGLNFGENGFQFQRIDGQSSLSRRKEALEKFSSDPECNIMLASIGAAGEGIDLTAANSVHIVEPHWNPMAEAQAVDRVHRIGQKQDVEIVRYIVDESIELYIQWVQMHKMRLINNSLSESEQNSGEVSEERWKKLLEYLG